MKVEFGSSYINNLNINKNIDNKKINKSNLISKFINVNKKNKSVGEINENKSLLNELNFKMKDSQFIRSNIRKSILEKGRLIRKNIINFHRPKKNSSDYNINLIQKINKNKQLSANSSLSNSKKKTLNQNKSSSRFSNFVYKKFERIKNTKQNNKNVSLNNKQIAQKISFTTKNTPNNSKSKISKNNKHNLKKKSNSCDKEKSNKVYKANNIKNYKNKNDITLLSLEKNLDSIAYLHSKIKKMVSQTQRDILNIKKNILSSFNSYEIISDEKNEIIKKTKRNEKVFDNNFQNNNSKINDDVIKYQLKNNDINLDENIIENELQNNNNKPIDNKFGLELQFNKMYNKEIIDEKEKEKEKKINKINIQKNEMINENEKEKEKEKKINKMNIQKNEIIEGKEKDNKNQIDFNYIKKELKLIDEKLIKDLNSQKIELTEKKGSEIIKSKEEKENNEEIKSTIKLDQNKIPNLEKLINNSKRQNTNSTLSSSNRDSNYYLTLSVKLSNYIKTYYLKYNNYPETSLSFYKYGRLIGQGAFGKVNLGLNILTGRIVAIKSFNKKTLSKNNNEKKILYETNLMKQLNHPNITKILELFETEDYIFIIMEYINGGNLFSFIKKRRKLSEKTAKFLFKQIIEGIKHIHSKNIVHRDIKLENILIDLKNNIKICDFGIGKILKKKKEKLFEQCGTPMYMAPEIYLCTSEKGYDPFPVDLWSSGIALYIMLSGTIPFLFSDDNNNNNSFSNDKENKKNNNILKYNIINNQPKEIKDISKEANDLIMGLLNKNPKKRYTINDVLNHPWLKSDENVFNSKYRLFTKNEMIMLSKTYIDYRFARIDEIKENFTISNLQQNDSNFKENNSNCLTKSHILAPYNSAHEYSKSNYENSNDNDDDDFKRNDIKVENEVILFSHKVKEFNLHYELNNNCELDNGILINTKSNNNTFSNLTISTLNNEDKSYNFDDENNFIFKNKINIGYATNGKIQNEKQQKENLFKKIEDLGYNQKYVSNCLNNNVLCHATAIYYLMKNYENI